MNSARLPGNLTRPVWCVSLREYQSLFAARRNPQLTEEAQTYMENIRAYHAGRLRRIVNYNREPLAARLWCEIENPVWFFRCQSLPPFYLETESTRPAGRSAAQTGTGGLKGDAAMEDMHELTRNSRRNCCAMNWRPCTVPSSYKIGRAVTWLPRHAARGLKYLLHNGPVVSVRYIVTYLKYRKIANKNYALLGLPAKEGLPGGAEKVVPGDQLHPHAAGPGTPQNVQRKDPVAQTLRRL